MHRYIVDMKHFRSRWKMNSVAGDWCLHRLQQVWWKRGKENRYPGHNHQYTSNTTWCWEGNRQIDAGIVSYSSLTQEQSLNQVECCRISSRQCMGIVQRYNELWLVFSVWSWDWYVCRLIQAPEDDIVCIIFVLAQEGPFSRLSGEDNGHSLLRCNWHHPQRMYSTITSLWMRECPYACMRCIRNWNHWLLLHDNTLWDSAWPWSSSAWWTIPHFS